MWGSEEIRGWNNNESHLNQFDFYLLHLRLSPYPLSETTRNSFDYELCRSKQQSRWITSELLAAEFVPTCDQRLHFSIGDGTM